MKTIAAHAAPLALAAALSACLGGCGGQLGDDIELALARTAVAEAEGTATAAAPAARVWLKGCVVDQYFIPKTGTTVRLRSADGRLLGHTASDGQGVFAIQVPPTQVVSVNVDKDGGETQALVVGPGDTSSTNCLQDSAD